jgi:hypothetical protein
VVGDNIGRGMEKRGWGGERSHGSSDIQKLRRNLSLYFYNLTIPKPINIKPHSRSLDELIKKPNLVLNSQRSYIKLVLEPTTLSALHHKLRNIWNPK